MRRSRWPAIVCLVAVVACLFVAVHARYSTDLAAFLPSTPDVRQRLLVKLLREGPASQLLLISIDGADPATRSRLSHELAASLRGRKEFSGVANGETAAFERDSAVLFRHRYLLSSAVTPERFTVQGLTQAMQATVAEQGATLGLTGMELLTHDPTGEMQQILDRLDANGTPRTANGVWVSADGARALLMARTVASGADSDGQIHAIEVLHEAFAGLGTRAGGPAAARLTLTGPAVFAADARRTIQHEVGRLSVLSMVLIGSLLLLVYRSVTLLLIGFLPVVCGALAGISAIALGFDVVYGITLGFGITLIGEAVDYSVYLFTQATRGGDGIETTPGQDWTTSLWPVIRLGMLTSVCGFASLLPSAFPSLAQLGLYTIAGLVAAALVTRFVLPGLLPKRTVLAAPGLATRSFTRLVAALQRARHVLWPLALLAIVVLLIHRDRLWSHELSALSPVSAADQRRDADLRADLGAADVSELVVVAGPDMDQVLKVSEQVTGKLDELIARNDIAGYESPSRYLPSQSTQRARLDSLPEESALRARVAVAAHAAGLRASRLEPFIADVIAAHDGPLLGPHDLEGTAMASGLDSLLVRLGDDWTALLPLRSIRQGGAGRDIDPVRIEKAVAPLSSAGIRVEALNLKQEADSLYETYLHSAMRLCCAGLAAIALLLCIALRSFARAARVLLPLAVAALCVAAGFALSHRPMNLLHLVGLLLIFAVGSNYALFFDRGSMSSGHFVHPRTLGSLLLANLTTTIAFGVLATSSVPVLSALGSTVAPGAVLALLCSAVLAGGTARAAPAEADGR